MEVTIERGKVQPDASAQVREELARLTPRRRRRTATCTEGRAKPEGGAMLPSVFSGDSRHIYFNGLPPGVLSTIEVRCLGGADPGYSDWSDPTSHRAM